MLWYQVTHVLGAGTTNPYDKASVEVELKVETRPVFSGSITIWCVGQDPDDMVMKVEAGLNIWQAGRRAIEPPGWYSYHPRQQTTLLTLVVNSFFYH